VKVLVTGSRRWSDGAAVLSALRDVGATCVIEGGAFGADECAQRAAAELGIDSHSIPAQWKQHGRKAGPMRNQQMLDEHPDIALVLAFPLPNSRGTWDMCERAAKSGIEVRVFGETGFRPHRFVDFGPGRVEMLHGKELRLP
jgi:hypothetical protein